MKCKIQFLSHTRPTESTQWPHLDSANMENFHYLREFFWAVLLNIDTT